MFLEYQLLNWTHTKISWVTSGIRVRIWLSWSGAEAGIGKFKWSLGAWKMQPRESQPAPGCDHQKATWRAWQRGGHLRFPIIWRISHCSVYLERHFLSCFGWLVGAIFVHQVLVSNVLWPLLSELWNALKFSNEIWPPWLDKLQV